MRSSVAFGLLFCLALAHGFKLPHELLLHRVTRSSAASETCPTYVCATEGENCNPPSNGNIPICVVGGNCGDDTAGVCPTVPGLGEACSDTLPCAIGYNCGLSSSTCVTIASIKVPGEACDSNDECVYTNSTGVYGICQSGHCYGIPIDSACANDDQCINSFCKQGVCTKFIATGGYCSNTSICIMSDVCSGNRCIPIGSRASGQQCNSTEACGDGLYCTQAGKCKTGFSAGKTCKSSADCPGHAPCGCDGSHSHKTCISPKANPKGFTAAAKAFTKCAIAHNCLGVQCTTVNCPKQYCAYRGESKIASFPSGNCLFDYYREHFDIFLPNIAACN